MVEPTTGASVTVADLPNEYDVAVVVLAKARGVNAHDAADRVRVAVHRLLGQAAPIHLPHRGQQVEGADIEVYSVMDAGVALGNGYLWAAPTSKARREVTDEPLAGEPERRDA